MASSAHRSNGCADSFASSTCRQSRNRREVIMKVGFIGLGHMGSGMAANLLKAGHQVTVYNRTLAKVESLVAQGARAAASVADACRGDASHHAGERRSGCKRHPGSG